MENFTRDVNRDVLLDSIRFCKKTRVFYSCVGIDGKSRPDDRSDGHLHMNGYFNAKQEPGFKLKT